ncbi:MAG: hypothetical protein ABFS41_20155, partial [Myxococcota bacterium]
MRLLRWVLALVLGLVVGVPLLAVATARLALDRELRHTHATAALPRFAAAEPDGLVRIPARGFEFRARVA